MIGRTDLSTDLLLGFLEMRCSTDFPLSTQDTPERSQRAAEALAHLIVEAASENARSGSFRSPWAVEAAAAGALPFWARLLPRGGKLDDITAVVGYVAGPQPKAVSVNVQASPVCVSR